VSGPILWTCLGAAVLNAVGEARGLIGGEAAGGERRGLRQKRQDGGARVPADDGDVDTGRVQTLNPRSYI
jgi:hypothetical protein